MRNARLSTLLAALFATTILADVGGAGEPLKSVDARKIIQNAKIAGALPAGVVVRVHAHLWKAGAKDTTDFHECWEFTSAEVHRVVTEQTANKINNRREKSLAFDSRRICHDLAEGKIFEIHENKGPGKPVNFALALTAFYNRGERSIEILVDDKSVFRLAESCLTAGYREPHARAFATLYEKLASQARAAFGDFWARKILLEASKTGAWPRGMVVRLGADIHVLGDMSTKFKEDWEFSEGQVHRIVLDSPKKNEVVHRREKSLTLDTKTICKDLIDGRAFEIASDESPENGLLLADFEKAVGGRSIEVLIDGKTALDLCEHCTFGGYGETHARAFARLYEKLASQARAAFSQSKAP